MCHYSFFKCTVIKSKIEQILAAMWYSFKQMFITQYLNNATMLKNNKINDNKHKSFNKFTFFMLFYWLKNNICGAINLKQV